MKKPASCILWVGIDPGAKSGVAYQAPLCDLSTQAITGVPPVGEPCALFDDMHEQAKEMSWHVVIAIERSHYRSPRFAAHRADAKKWEAFLRNRFARRNGIHLIDPNSWQKGLGVYNPANEPTKGTVIPYTDYARRFLGVAEEATQDECAAACILEFNRRTWVGEK